MSSALSFPVERRKPRGLLLAVATILVVLVLKWHYLGLLKVDSDEPQHLHVVWLWTQGLLPYRDAFDNHMPLFSWSMAPLLRWVGERPDAVLAMRLPMLLLWLVGLWPLALIALASGGRRVLPLALLLVTLDTVLFAYSQQFRPDNPWAVFWLTAMAALSGAGRGRGRLMLAGLFAGAALATSMKTSVLLATLAAAAVSVAVVERRRLFAPGEIASFVLGMAVLPVTVVMAIRHAGLFDEFYRCVIADNLGSGLHQQTQLLRWTIALVLFPLAQIAVLRAFRPCERETFPVRVVLLAGTWALIVFRVLWPSFTDQDQLPTLPIVLVLAALWIERGTERWTERHRGVLFAAVALGLLALLQLRHPFDEDAAAEDTARRSAVLALSGPGDEVLDAKGESVFRRRPVYPVFELLTLHRIRRGDLRLDLARELRERRVGVVLPSRVVTDDAFADFLRANFLEVAPGVLLAGKRLEVGTGQGGTEFALAIAGDYRIDGCDASCRVDGAAVSAPLHLAAGSHRLDAEGPRQIDLLLASSARLPSYHAAPPQLEAPLCPSR